MTAQEAIRELQKVRNYCNATSIPAIDYAIEAILEKEDRASRAVSYTHLTLPTT